MTRRDDLDTTTIGVSCGHRVPRKPVHVKPGFYGFRYWCSTCGEYRMAGGKSTGERAFDFLLALRDEISTRGLVVDVDETVPAHGLAVIEAFGATIRRQGRGHHGHPRRSVGFGGKRTFGADAAQPGG